MENLNHKLEELLREVREAHAEESMDDAGEDPEWALWYADRLKDPLNQLLTAELTMSDLVYLLVRAARERALEAPGSLWERYCARFFLERYD